MNDLEALKANYARLKALGAVTKLFTMEFKQVEKLDPMQPMYVDGIANGVKADRGGEKMPPEVWKKGMKNYKNNPIIMFNHKWDEPIGRAIELDNKEHGLEIKTVIGEPDCGHPLTDCQIKCRSLIAQNILKTWSVSFIPKDWDYDEKTDELIWKDVELLEVSLVTIPMQQDSLVTSVKSFINEKVKRMDTTEKADTPTDPNGNGRTSSADLEAVYKVCQETHTKAALAHEVACKCMDKLLKAYPDEPATPATDTTCPNCGKDAEKLAAAEKDLLESKAELEKVSAELAEHKNYIGELEAAVKRLMGKE